MQLKSFTLESEFKLQFGGRIRNPMIAYHISENFSQNTLPLIWVFHGLTANSNPTDWWSGLFGEGMLLNTKEYRVICCNVIYSEYGSTTAKSVQSPIVSVRDNVVLQIALAKELQIENIDIAIGASFGGAQALEFTHSFPGKINQLILLASAAAETSWGLAIHETQRAVMESDPTFGKEQGGKAGLANARSIGMLSYRSPEDFSLKQSNDFEEMRNSASYIRYQGEKFKERFSPINYYCLTKTLDTHNIGRNRGTQHNASLQNTIEALQKISTNTLIIGFSTDLLIPVKEQEFLKDNIRNATLEIVNTPYGHDGFLIESEQITKILKKYLCK